MVAYQIVPVGCDQNVCIKKIYKRGLNDKNHNGKLYEKQNTEKYSLYQMAIQRFLGSIFSNIIIGTELTHFWKLFNFKQKI